MALEFVLFIASRCWVQLFVEFAKPVSFKWFSKCLFGLKQLHVQKFEFGVDGLLS